MRRNFLILAIAASAAAGCATWDRREQVHDQISADMDRTMIGRAKPAPADAVSRALLPPLVVELPKLEARPLEPRFDLNVNNAPAGQVFMAIVSGTRYSMVVHPDVRDTISVNLKDVTVLEALETLRDLYGYEYRVQGNRITVQSVSLQTRVFKVNYLQASRSGRSDVRVSSGSITDAPTAAAGVPGSPAPTASTGALPQRLTESSRVTTSSESNFWSDIVKSLTAIVGAGDGRNVIVNPQSGVIVVRALPADLRSVESFLKAMQLIVERQVVLEAKIVEVELREGFEAGINWSGFNTRTNSSVAGGVIRPGTTLSNTGPISSPTGLLPDGSIDPASAFTATLGTAASLVTGATTPGAVFGLALQTSDFAALLAFIDTQGAVNVLSSPRVATLNNQKAVLKVGTDDFFVTNVSTTTTVGSGGTTTSPTITVQPFFSGIALDVTPQIDDNNNIILHVHPQVSSVIERTKTIVFGSETFTLPLASSTVNETDTIVRVQDGNIVAIGGLMRQDSATARSQVPGLGDVPGVGLLFQQRNTRTTKSEIVILLKPTIIHSDGEWQRDLADTRERIRALRGPQPSQPQPSQP